MSNWTLTFRPTDGGEPTAALRVRRLLKFALRTCGLRCVGIRETLPPSDKLVTQTRGETTRKPLEISKRSRRAATQPDAEVTALR